VDSRKERIWGMGDGWEGLGGEERLVLLSEEECFGWEAQSSAESAFFATFLAK